MELRRNRTSSTQGWLLLALGLLLVLVAVTTGPGRAVALIVCALGLGALAVPPIVQSLRPFRVAIGADGLTLRRFGVDRLVPWAEIEAVVLDAPMPRVLVVPAAGVDLDALPAAESPVDGRPCRVLFTFGEVADPPDRVAEALVAVAGERFTDLRTAVRERLGAAEFSVVLRGYEHGEVDALIEQGQRALASGTATDRLAARQRIEAAALPVVLRGYDRAQVDEYLGTLAATLGDAGDDPSPDRGAREF